MKTRTVITREGRKNRSLLRLVRALAGNPTHSLFIEAKPGPEQDTLMFVIHELANGLQIKLHLRTTPAGVWVRSPYPKCNSVSEAPDEVRIAIVGVRGEKRLCLMVSKINSGMSELEAVEVPLRK